MDPGAVFKRTGIKLFVTIQYKSNPTAQDKVEVYNRCIELLEKKENSHWCDTKCDGLCHLVQVRVFDTIRSTNHYLTNLVLYRTCPGGYWFRNRQERLDALRKAIDELQNTSI